MGKLHDACEKGDLRQVKKLLQAGPLTRPEDINEADKFVSLAIPTHFAKACRGCGRNRCTHAIVCTLIL